MASACSTASAAACCRSRVVAPTIGAGTCIGTRVAKAGARRQSDADPARQSPFERATTHRYPSGEAAGTGTHRTAAGWKGSILIRRGHDRARLHSCAFPNQPKQPIVPPRDALPEAVAVAKRYEAYLTTRGRARRRSSWSRTRIAQTSFGFNGRFWPINWPLFHGLLVKPTRLGIGRCMTASLIPTPPAAARVIH